MRTAYWKSVVAVCLIGAVGQLGAQDLSKLTDAQRKQLNAWMAERAERVINAHQMEGELTHAVNDTAHTSPEIEVLRKRSQDLQDELSRVRTDLQKKVMALPALQEKKSALEQERKRINELSGKVKALTDSAR